MNLCLDTGKCAPEGTATLRIQQGQLISGKRSVQMFPTGSIELALPTGMSRYKNVRGTFHFDPEKISSEEIEKLSSKGRENEFLNLGKYDKYDIALRAMAGEKVVCITEYTSEGVEVRSAAGTVSTILDQLAYFEQTKEFGNVIVIGDAPSRVNERII